MENDFSFKMLMSRIFWAWGYVPFVDVKLVRSDVALERTSSQELTDIDVLGIKFLPEYRTVRTAADCTTRRRGAMNRAFWLRGTLNLIGAEEGFVVVDPDKPISLDHRVSTRAIKVSLIDPQDARRLLERLEPDASILDAANMFKESAHRYLTNVDNLKEFGEALRYRKLRYWQDPVNEQLLNSVFLVRDISNRLDIRHKFHFVLAFSFMLMFAIAVLDTTWRTALATLTSRPDDLDMQLRYFLYGGEKNYRQRQRMVQFFSEKVGVPRETLFDSPEMSVAPPEWKSFLELYARLLSNPLAAPQIPRVLSVALFEKILYRNDAVYASEVGLKVPAITLKLAGDLAAYFAMAAKLPSLYVEEVRRALDISIRTDKPSEAEVRAEEQCSSHESAEPAVAKADTQS